MNSGGPKYRPIKYETVCPKNAPSATNTAKARMSSTAGNCSARNAPTKTATVPGINIPTNASDSRNAAPKPMTYPIPGVPTKNAWRTSGTTGFVYASGKQSLEVERGRPKWGTRCLLKERINGRLQCSVINCTRDQLALPVAGQHDRARRTFNTGPGCCLNALLNGRSVLAAV